MSGTVQPQLKIDPATVTPEQKELVKQLTDYHGVGECIPTSKGGKAKIRLNNDGTTLYLEANVSGAWQRI